MCACVHVWLTDIVYYSIVVQNYKKDILCCILENLDCPIVVVVDGVIDVSDCVVVICYCSL